MKSRKTSTLIIALLAVILSALSPKVSMAQPFGRVSLDLFYDELSPYGYWEQDRQFGDIWFPARVPRDFRPYGTNGYWTMTEYGNTWVSGYDWGWATFHYGRWVYTDYNGWGWIPGYEWGPAWVDWRTGGGYYGWAPMAPVMNVRVAVAMPINLWVFLPTRRIYDHRIHRYWSYGEYNVYNRTTVINNTYIVNNNHYYGGPGRRDIEHHIGRPVEVRTIRTTETRGASRVDNRSVSMYRPDRTTSTRTGTASTTGTRGNTVSTREGTTATRLNTVGTREGTTATRGNTVGTREGTSATRGNTVSTREGTTGSTSTRGNTVSTREGTTGSTATRGSSSTRGSAIGNSSSSNPSNTMESRRSSTGSSSSSRGAMEASRSNSSGSSAAATRTVGQSSRGSAQQAPAQIERSSSATRGEASSSRGNSSSAGERRTR